MKTSVSHGRRSLHGIERRIKLHLAPFFARRRLSTIDKIEVQHFIRARLDAGAKNPSINRELVILKRAYRLAEVARPLFALLRDKKRQAFFEREHINRAAA